MSAPTAGRGPVVIDTGVFGADLVPGSPLKPRYEPLITGRPAFIAFQTVAELRYGALDAVGATTACAGSPRAWPGRRWSGPVPTWSRGARFRLACEVAGHPLGQPTTTPTDGSLRPPFALAWPLVSHNAEFRNAPGLAVEPMLP